MQVSVLVLADQFLVVGFNFFDRLLQVGIPICYQGCCCLFLNMLKNPDLLSLYYPAVSLRESKRAVILCATLAAMYQCAHTVSDYLPVQYQGPKNPTGPQQTNIEAKNV